MVKHSRVETQSNPVSKDCGEGDGGEEISAEFVVSGCNTAEILEAAEGVFDPVAVFVALFIISDFALAVGSARDHGD